MAHGCYLRAAAQAAAMLLISMTVADAAVLYTYDDLGRVASITYDDGRRVTYSYDAAGNRTQHIVDLAPNLPPVALNDFGSIDIFGGYSTVISVLANDSDPNGDILIVQSVTAPSLGTAVIGGAGTFVTYTFNGSATLPAADTFSYTVSDGRGGLATATVSVDIFDSGGPCVPPPGQLECGL